MTTTLIGIGVLLVLVVVFDVWRNGGNWTISELFWWTTRTSLARAAFLVGFLLGVVGGHLAWQSGRTYRALDCEARGGVMTCIGGQR